LQFGPDLVRPYSMAGLPGDDTLEFHVRVVPGGRVSNFIASELRPGAAVKVTGPLGTSYLRRKHTGPMLCVAGGTGLAPVLSIVRGALQGGMHNPVHLYLGVRSPRDVYGLPWLQSLSRDHTALHIHVVVMEGAEAGQRAGLVTDAMRQDGPDLRDARAYLCGSPPMVEAATQLVLHLGLTPERVHADAFYNQTT
jgi:naphthalene 1,2-dioxygenase ferredoxin reductase component